MSMWYLIIYMSLGYGQHSIQMFEFSSKERCESGYQEIVKMKDNLIDGHSCTLK